jgi:hypothetical protein
MERKQWRVFYMADPLFLVAITNKDQYDIFPFLLWCHFLFICTELEFVNDYRVQESIPRNLFCFQIQIR